MTQQRKIIAIAKAEVGYHEGFKDGHWDNIEKYADAVPTLTWAQGQPWCAVFVSWCAQQAGLADLFPCTASTDAGAKWFKDKGQWNEYPAVGAQVFYGTNGNMVHTGLVYKFDDTYVYTVEGNTNSDGSAEGDGVYLKKRVRRDAYVQGYGYPKYENGINSADPAVPKPVPAPRPEVKPVTFVTANLDWATGAKADADQLRHDLSLGDGLLVLCAQEAKNLRGKSPLPSVLPYGKGAYGKGPFHAKTVVHDESSAAKAGTALVAYGTRLRFTRIWLAGRSKATLARYVAQGRVRLPDGSSCVAYSAHVFPARVGRLIQNRYLAVLRKHLARLDAQGVPWIVGADWNMPIHDAAKALGGHAYGRGIVGFICSKKVQVSAYKVDHYGQRHKETDHPAVVIEVTGVRK